VLTAAAMPGLLLMSSRASADRGRVVRPRRRSDPNCAALADIDHRVLAVLCDHRVVRQDQLQRLFPDVPERTLRYRTRRLHDFGLAGRSRPYRERGSAPNHHWPTRRADCVVRGDPMPRGGERYTPNPVFLAHAAALTELYVTLATQAQSAGLELLIYRREGEARETFKDGGKERTLAPDATVVIVDGENRKLGAFVEIDLGTMSHARLRFKAGLYAAYARSDVWREHHLFLPALLFLTTTPARASRFLKALERALQESARGYSTRSRTSLIAAAGALALTPGRLLGEEVYLSDLDGRDDLRLLDVLNDARAPYERALAYWKEREEEEEKQRHRLREDPEAMREHLHHNEHVLSHYIEALGATGTLAMKLLLVSNAPPMPDEREVLRAIARDLGDALLEPGTSTLPSPGAAAKGQAALLIDSYRSIQKRQLRALADRHGVGPHLRKAAAQLRSGLIEPRDLQALPREAERDAAGREEQHERRFAYLEWRKGAARQRARKAGPLGRLTHRAGDFYEPVDRRWLRVCRRCEEIVYPTVGSGGLQEEPACHYCHSTERVTACRKDDRTDQEGEMYL
jgi:Replication-relaxation